MIGMQVNSMAIPTSLFSYIEEIFCAQLYDF